MNNRTVCIVMELPTPNCSKAGVPGNIAWIPQDRKVSKVPGIKFAGLPDICQGYPAASCLKFARIFIVQ